MLPIGHRSARRNQRKTQQEKTMREARYMFAPAARATREMNCAN
jgi:hypothetical protein